MYKSTVKPFLDFILSFFAFILLSPLFLAITLLLAFANKGKPLFTHTRPGKDERIFKVIKFKTMNDKRDANGNLLPGADRLTSVGSLLRKTSLDELPQLINVIKGDMSLVGPRPLLVEYLPVYNKEQKRRHGVKPGITGWAQVNGRNSISWKQKFIYDIWYVDNISFMLDIKIIFMTFKKVFIREGINQDGNTTMEFFNGDN